MKLSDRQVHIVNAFLRDAALETPSEPPSARVKVLTHLRRQLREELARRNDSLLRDDELIRLLNRIQFPERAALADAVSDRRSKSGAHSAALDHGANGGNGVNGANVQSALLDICTDVPELSAAPPSGLETSHRIRHTAQPFPAGPLASSQRIWLGACIALAERFDVPIERIRGGAIILGLLSGPIAVILYLVTYTVFYLGEHGKGAPRVDRIRVLRAVGTVAAGIIVMSVLFAVAVSTVNFVHRLAIGYPPDSDQWSSFAQGVNHMLFFAAVIMMPFAALRGLPVAPPWDLHLPRLIRGAFAALASLLALALASYLTGALISGIRDWPA
jgi:hypothetical protein